MNELMVQGGGDVLCISRKEYERFRLDLGDGRFVWVQILETDGRKVRVGITADLSVKVMREELIQLAPMVPCLEARTVEQQVIREGHA